MDRAARKIIVEYGCKFPASLTSLLYLPREKGSRGLRSVEQNRIRTNNSDQTVEVVREFEEHAMLSGH